jgi:hypothetical protein
MKTLLTVSTLLFTLMFSSTSFAGWTKVNENMRGDTYYVDNERIRKHDGFVYFWTLLDLLKPDPYGDMSYKMYHQGDCKLFRYKILSGSFHKEPMGGGTGEPYTPPDKWVYPPPNTPMEPILKSVCSR